MATVKLIAVIDDDFFVCNAVRGLLEAMGYEPITFTSAEDLLASPLLTKTECLIADVQLPGMSGLDLQHQLSLMNLRIPMIFITGFPDDRVRHRALSAGALDYLAKPVGRSTLEASIRRAPRTDQ